MRGRQAGFAVGLLSVAIFAYFFGGDALATLSRADPSLFALYLLTALAVRAGYVLRWRSLVRALRLDASTRRLTMARLAADSVAAISPAGRVSGDPVRVWMLYDGAHRPSRIAASVALDRLIETFGNSFAAMAYVVVFWLAWGGESNGWGGFGVGMAVATAGLLTSLVLLARGHLPLAPLYYLIDRLGVRRLRAAMIGVRRAERHARDLLHLRPNLAVAAIVGSLLIETVTVIEYSLIFRAFGAALDLPLVLLSMLVGGISRAAPTPGGLGAFEAGQVAAFGAAVGQPELGFTIGLITRVHEVLWAAIGFLALLLAGVPLGRLRSQLATGKAAAT